VIALVLACAAPAPADRHHRPADELPADPVATVPVEPAFVTWSAAFGWDEGLVDVVTEYGRAEPEIVVTVGDAAWESVGFDPARGELYCEVAFPLDDAGPAAWTADDARLWHALDAGPPSRSTCPDGVLSEAPWGVAVGELSPSADEFVDFAFVRAERRAVFGGRFVAGDQLAADDDVYGRAWPLDDEDRLVADATGASEPLDADELFADDALTRGWYRLESIYVRPWQR
jgi:hypothetical protein